MKLSSILTLMLLCWLTVSEKHEKLELNKAYSQSFNQQTGFVGRYVFEVPEEEITKLKGSRWFFFVEVEPQQEQEWISTQIFLSIAKKGSNQSHSEHRCGTTKGGVDSCFFTNKQFDYKTDQIHANVMCRGPPCKYKISAEVSEPYKLKVGDSVKMDFQTTAYTKVFVLDTRNTGEFDQLRIILRPEGFLRFAAPIGLYVNKGHSLPTRKDQDFKSVTLWDNGQGVFIDSPDDQGQFTIVVEGPQKNILLLETELLSFKESYDVKEAIPHFDYVGSGDTKKFKCKVNAEKGMLLKLSTFSGSVKLTGIFDAKMELVGGEDDQLFPALYRSFSQMEYQIPPAFFKDMSDYEIKQFLIFQVEGVKESTFLFEYYQLNLGITHLLPEVNRYVELPSQEVNQYYVEIVEVNDPQFKKASIEIIFTHEESKQLNVRFFKCEKDQVKSCQLNNSELKAEKLEGEVGPNFRTVFGDGVVIYRFDLPAKLFKKVKQDVKLYVLGVVVENKAKEEHLYTVRYSNIGHNTFLKEKQLQKDRVEIDQHKYYLFTNQHTDVKEIRVHLTEIAGKVKAEGFYEDPRAKDRTGQQVYAYHGMVRFTDLSKGQTIYLRLTGKQMAYYSLQVQLVKEGEKEWWKNADGGKGKGYNEIMIFQNIPYEFTIQPNEKAVYQLHTKYTKFFLQLSSLLPVDLCMTEEIAKPPFAPNCEVKEVLNKKVLMDVEMERGNIGNIGVTNNNQKVNKFHIRFYSLDKKPLPQKQTGQDLPSAKCLPTLMGKVSRHKMTTNTSICFSYFMSKIEDTQLMVDIVSDQYKEVSVLAVVGLERVEVIGALHIFKKAELSKACKGEVPCVMKLFVDSGVDSQVRFALQPLSGTILLLDGVANKFSGQRASRYFIYEITNKQNTTIVLQNRKGSFKFYGEAVQASDFYNKKVSYPSSLSHSVQSVNPYYFNYQIGVLTDNQIKEASCKECLLLLTVERESDDHESGQFVIEVTQEERKLKENTPMTGYLNKRSVAFYEFSVKTQGLLLVSLNTQNQDCARLFVKKGQERATPSNFDEETHDGSHTLLIEKAQKGRYSLSIEATQNCYYSVDYSTSQSKVYSSIERGLYTDIKLGKDEQKKTLYNHKSEESFRILTLHQTGQVIIKVKPYKTIKDFLDDNSTKERYAWSGRDFLRVEKDHPKFCVDCFYLVVFSAERATKTSVMIPSSSSEFPIMIDSTIKQQLLKGEIEKLRVYSDGLLQFQIKVLYGQVNVTLFSKQKEDDHLFTKVYKASDKTQYQMINSTHNRKGDQFYFMSYTKIIIKAEKNCSFTFGLISNKDENQRGNRVKYGIPEYMTLSNNEEQCLVGLLDEPGEEFLISITGDKQVDLMNSMEVSCKLNEGKELLQLSKQIAKNQMIVTIDKAPTSQLPADYQFCFKSKENVFFTFIQISKVIYLPEMTSVFVNGVKNFTFYSEGKSLLEINECKSRAIVTVYNSFSTSDRVNSQIKQLRRTNNIVEFMYYGPVYLQAQAKGSTIAWRKKDQLKGLGTGYDQYMPTRLRYQVDGASFGLKVQVSELKKSVLNKVPQIKLSGLNYTVFLAVEEMNLYEAINCENGEYLSSWKAAPEGGTLSFNFNVADVVDKFGKYKYIMVGAMVNGNSSIEGDGKYRFIYPYQEVPMALLKGQVIYPVDPIEPPIPLTPNLNPKPIPGHIEKGHGGFLTYLAIFVLVAFGLLLAYSCVVKKCLKRRRMKRLSEQGTGDVHYQQFASYRT